MSTGEIFGGKKFQSTHPVRGATLCKLFLRAFNSISIHAPREGCDNLQQALTNACLISIHAPREGCDLVRYRDIHLPCTISIHAPREGCDSCCMRLTGRTCYFNPRTP